MDKYQCQDCKEIKLAREFKKAGSVLSRTCKKCFGKKVWGTRRANKHKEEQEKLAKLEAAEHEEKESEPELIDIVVDLFDRISEVFADAADLLRR